MDEVRPYALIRLRDAVQYRDGLMIALLAFMPMRNKNVTALATDRRLVRDGDSSFVVIDGDETKTGSAIEFAIPDLLSLYLDN